MRKSVSKLASSHDSRLSIYRIGSFEAEGGFRKIQEMGFTSTIHRWLIMEGWGGLVGEDEEKKTVVDIW